MVDSNTKIDQDFYNNLVKEEYKEININDIGQIFLLYVIIAIIFFSIIKMTHIRLDNKIIITLSLFIMIGIIYSFKYIEDYNLPFIENPYYLYCKLKPVLMGNSCHIFTGIILTDTQTVDDMRQKLIKLIGKENLFDNKLIVKEGKDSISNHKYIEYSILCDCNDDNECIFRGTDYCTKENNTDIVEGLEINPESLHLPAESDRTDWVTRRPTLTDIQSEMTGEGGLFENAVSAGFWIDGDLDHNVITPNNPLAELSNYNFDDLMRARGGAGEDVGDRPTGEFDLQGLLIENEQSFAAGREISEEDKAAYMAGLISCAPDVSASEEGVNVDIQTGTSHYRLSGCSPYCQLPSSRDQFGNPNDVPTTFTFYDSDSNVLSPSSITETSSSSGATEPAEIYYNCPTGKIGISQDPQLFNTSEIQKIQANKCTSPGEFIQSSSETCVESCGLPSSKLGYEVKSSVDSNMNDLSISADAGTIPAANKLECKNVENEPSYRPNEDLQLTITRGPRGENCGEIRFSGCRHYCKLPDERDTLIIELSLQDLLDEGGDGGNQQRITESETNNQNKPIILIDNNWFTANGGTKPIFPYTFSENISVIDGMLDSLSAGSAGTFGSNWDEIADDNYISCNTGYNHYSEDGTSDQTPELLRTYNIETCKPSTGDQEGGEYLTVRGCYPSCRIGEEGVDECIDGVVKYSAETPLTFIDFCTRLKTIIDSRFNTDDSRILFVRKSKIYDRLNSTEYIIYEYLFRCPKGDDESSCNIVPNLLGGQSLSDYRQRMAPVGH